MEPDFLRTIYRVCLTVFTFGVVTVGVDAFYPGRFITYYQFVSFFSMIFAATVMVLGLKQFRKTIFSDSFMWAGIFLIVYGVATVFMDSSAQFRFIVLALGFGITFYTGYLKFVKEETDAKIESSSTR